MRTATWLRRAGWLGAFAVTIWIAPLAGADEPPKPKAAGDLGPAEELVPRAKFRVRLAQDLIDDTQSLGNLWHSGKYSLKLSLSGIPRSLDAQLQLNGEGALVSSVGEGGPAAQAGLKVHDILVTVADEPIKKITAVIEAVNESEGHELHFKVLRAGKPIVITIKPAIREGYLGHVHYAADAEKAAKEATRRIEIELRELEETLHEKLKDAGVHLRMHLIQPGRFVQRGFILNSDKPEDFPEDLTIEVRKHGKEPAKIEVKQGDKSWTVTDDKLDELPEEVRKHVKALLGRTAARYSYNVTMPKLSEEARKRARVASEEARNRARSAAEAVRDRAAEMRERLGGRLDRRLDEMSREMKQMRQRMEELRRSLRQEAERREKGADES